MTREQFDAATGPDRRAGGRVRPATVAAKIVRAATGLGASRYDLKYSAGTLPHEVMMRSIELYATEVVPMVRRGDRATWPPDRPGPHLPSTGVEEEGRELAGAAAPRVGRSPSTGARCVPIAEVAERPLTARRPARRGPGDARPRPPRRRRGHRRRRPLPRAAGGGLHRARGGGPAHGHRPVDDAAVPAPPARGALPVGGLPDRGSRRARRGGPRARSSSPARPAPAPRSSTACCRATRRCGCPRAGSCCARCRPPNPTASPIPAAWRWPSRAADDGRR